MLNQNEEENSVSEEDSEDELNSVLDSEDIDEVKQLLEDDSNEEFELDELEVESGLDEDLSEVLKDIDTQKSDEDEEGEDFSLDNFEEEKNSKEDTEEEIVQELEFEEERKKLIH